MAGVGELSVRLGLDAAEFTRGLTRAEREAQKFHNSMASIGTKIGTALGALTSVVSVGLVVEGFRRIVGALDDLDEASQALGVSAVALAEYRRAATESGVASEKFDAALTKLNVRLVDAAGGGKQSIAAFKTLGIEIRNSSGQLKTTEELLGDVANKFQGYRDGAEKSALAVALFGRAGAAMIPFLNQGSEGLRKLTGVTTEGIEAARKLQAQFDTLKGGLQDFGTSIAVGVMPFLTKMIEEMTAAHRAAGGLLGALVLLGSQSAKTLADPGQKIGELTEKLAALRAEAAQAPPEGFIGALVGGAPIDRGPEIQAIEKELKFLKELQRNRALANAGTNFSNEGFRFLRTPPVIPKGGGPDKKNKEDIDENTKAFARYVEQLASGLEKEEKLSKVQEVTRAIEQNRFGVLIPQQQHVLLFLAQQVDAQEEYNAKIEHNKKLERELFDEMQKRQDLVDDLFGVTANKKANETIKVLQEELNSGRKTLDEYTAAWNRAFSSETTAKIDDANDAAKELGLTFSSAVEDAIVDFNNVRDVLKGLEKDLLRIGTRKLVTEPLANWATDLFKGIGSSGGGGDVFSSIIEAIGGLFGGSHASGMDFVPRDMLAYVHRGEKIVPAHENKNNGNSVINATFVLPPGGYTRATQDQIASDMGRAVNRASRRLG